MYCDPSGCTPGVSQEALGCWGPCHDAWKMRTGRYVNLHSAWQTPIVTMPCYSGSAIAVTHIATQYCQYIGSHSSRVIRCTCIARNTHIIIACTSLQVLTLPRDTRDQQLLISSTHYFGQRSSTRPNFCGLIDDPFSEGCWGNIV